MTRGKVTSEYEKVAIVRAIVALGQAIIGLRLMVMGMKTQNDNDFDKAYVQCSTALDTLLQQIDLLMEALNKDG
jgi:hypothetical protein